MADETAEQLAERLTAAAVVASRRLVATTGAERNAALLRMAERLRASAPEIVAANAEDLSAAAAAGLSGPLVLRLKLDAKKVAAMADAVEAIARQPEVIGQVVEGYERPNGMRISRVRVPLGVVLFLYESRPNVTSDAAALCVKSGNAVILRGGKEAHRTNTAVARVIAAALAESGIDAAAVQLVPTTDRAVVAPLLKMEGRIDVAIPRGGESLIRAVVAEARIPVLKHFTGNCHLYLDASSAHVPEMARKIAVNAKTSYPGGAVCNAIEKILVHKDAAAAVLPGVLGDLASAGVEVRGCERTRAIWPKAKAAQESDWPTEYLDLIVAVKVVDDIDAAIAHINHYGSRHTDGIVSTDTNAIDRFVRDVDSASVMVNVSTRFADGGEYGLGAEIGISTDKLHARGPMGAADMTTTKWVVRGNGQVR